MNSSGLEEINKVFFIGIGGIGMSALARYLKSQGKVVSGYDKTSTKLTKKLESEGIEILYTDDHAKYPSDIDLVIYTPAIPSSHKGLYWYKEQGFKVIKRSEALGLISENKKCIAVAGTHGKTSTSALITQVLSSSEIAFSSFIGGLMLPNGINYVNRGSEWVVVEADEYDRSFLKLNPDIAILMSMDADHLDIYGDHKSMLGGYWAFIEKIRSGGTLIFKHDLEVLFPDNWKERLKAKKVSHVSFGLENGMAYSSDIQVKDGRFEFSFNWERIKIDQISSSMPGRHNIENSTAAIITGLKLGMAAEDIKKAIGTFKGIFRRFERLFEDEDLVYIDDYAHHPRELDAAISAAKELFPGKKITGIFQPHLYTRTRDFAQEFATALNRLDSIILCPIYPAREEPIPGVTSKIITRCLTNDQVWNLKESEVVNFLKDHKTDVIMTLGAGDIDLLREPIVSWLVSRKNLKR